jgi:hypothetical protein
VWKKGATPKDTTEHFVANEEKDRFSESEKPSLILRILRWLFPPTTSGDRRRGERIMARGLVAYYWTGGAPQAYQLANVSSSGLFLLTEERWRPGTRIVMTLQRSGNAQSEEIQRVESEVIRWGPNGVGCAFVESGFVDPNNGEIIEEHKFDHETFEQFLRRANSSASDLRNPRFNNEP